MHSSKNAAGLMFPAPVYLGDLADVGGEGDDIGAAALLRPLVLAVLRPHGLRGGHGAVADDGGHAVAHALHVGDVALLEDGGAVGVKVSAGSLQRR